jgi:hypothetical protein
LDPATCTGNHSLAHRWNPPPLLDHSRDQSGSALFFSHIFLCTYQLSGSIAKLWRSTFFIMKHFIHFRSHPLRLLADSVSTRLSLLISDFQSSDAFLKFLTKLYTAAKIKPRQQGAVSLWSELSVHVYQLRKTEWMNWRKKKGGEKEGCL